MRSRDRLLLWGAALVALLPAACTDPLAGVTGIAVTVRPCGDGPVGVTEIQLTLVPGSGAPEAQTFDVAGHALPVRVTAALPADRAGRYGVEVRAVAADRVLASGRGDVEVTAGMVEPIIIQLCDGVPVDGGPDLGPSDGPGPDAPDQDAPDGEPPPDGPGPDVAGDRAGGDRTGGDDPPVCGTGRLICGDDCIDVSSDADNCGACGHSCRGSTCRSGLCDPQVLAQGQREPSALSVGNGHLCWTNRGTAPAYADGEVRCREAAAAPGGSSPLVAASLNGAQALSVAGPEVFWVESGAPGSSAEGLVRGSSITLPDPFELATLEAVPQGVTSDGSSVFWVDGASPYRVRSVSVSGRDDGLDISGASAGLNPRAVVVDASHVYWVAEATASSDGSLRRVALAGGNVEVLATSLRQPRALALTEQHVVVVSWGSSDAMLDGSVVRVAKEGVRQTEALATAQAHPVAVAVSEGLVYWASAGAFDGSCSCYPAGTIQRMGLDSDEAPTVVARDQVGLMALQTDDRSLYWAVTGAGPTEGAIWRLAR